MLSDPDYWQWWKNVAVNFELANDPMACVGIDSMGLKPQAGEDLSKQFLCVLIGIQNYPGLARWLFHTT
jgi:hypothetical protein